MWSFSLPRAKSAKARPARDGVATFEHAAAGRYFVRAGYIEGDRGGKLDGKPYAQTWSYCTAGFQVGAFQAGAEAAAKGQVQTAARLLAAARANRSVWTKGFPGFKADAVVTIDGETKTGKLKIDSSGTVDLAMPEGKPADSARDQMESMVQHRMPDGQVSEGNVMFVDNDCAIRWAAGSRWATIERVPTASRTASSARSAAATTRRVSRSACWRSSGTRRRSIFRGRSR